ncbi:MAG: hypothetical protein ACYDBP_06240 [Leptospirales bacterium]
MDIGQERFEVRTVLDRNGRFRRKGRPDRFPATGTALDGTAMLGRDQRLGRQIEHLPGFDRQTVFLLEWSGIPAGATLRQMDEVLSGVSTGGRVCPGCPFCPPGFLSVGGRRLLGEGLKSRPMTGACSKVQVLSYKGPIEFIPVKPPREMWGLLSGIDTTIPCDLDRQ